ncbi:MAG: 7-carboxy-7-deazaguanine synthase [Acidimicrobiales bacterium]
MSYLVKEVLLTLQGEGANTGRAAVFCRFTGCNLWSGREEHRATATCRFCDTDFVGTDGPGGGRFADADDLADHVATVWDEGTGSTSAVVRGERLVVCTGGEPLLQLDDVLVAALHRRGFAVAIETNGTLPVPAGVDWVCVSPKAGADLVVTTGDELKVVFPQPGAEPERYDDLVFTHRFVQPMDGPELAANTAAAVDHCRRDPRWRLSLQTHKLLGIP